MVDGNVNNNRVAWLVKFTVPKLSSWQSLLATIQHRVVHAKASLV